MLKKWKGFKWTPECDKAFQSLKQYLVSPPNLSNLEPGEDFYMYLAVSEHIISTMLIRVQEGKQRPVYYVSKTLVDLETHFGTRH